MVSLFMATRTEALSALPQNWTAYLAGLSPIRTDALPLIGRLTCWARPFGRTTRRKPLKLPATARARQRTRQRGFNSNSRFYEASDRVWRSTFETLVCFTPRLLASSSC